MLRFSFYSTCCTGLLGAYLFMVPSVWSELPYTVKLTGNERPEVRQVIERYSQVHRLQNRPPLSAVGIYRRADADVSRILEGLHTLAYYNADVDIDINTQVEPAIVTIHIDTGKHFRLAEFHIVKVYTDEIDEDDLLDEDDILEQGRHFLERDFLDTKFVPIPELWEDNEDDSVSIEWVKNDASWVDAISLPELGIELGAPAYPQDILDAEDRLIDALQCRGFPLATVIKREVLADQETETLSVWIHVDPGPSARFGPVTITGNKRVREKYIRKKLAWKLGDCFSPQKISCTFDELDRSGLFHVINVDWDKETLENDLLPMHVHVSEAKHRSVGAGFIYATEWGAGFLGEWEHRNFRGMGEKVTAKAELLRKHQTGLFRYRKPDFLCYGMDLVNSIEAEQELTDSFDETAVTAASRLHYKLTPQVHVWGGVATKYTVAEDSDNNRTFVLGQVPLQLRYSDADSLLDPHYGKTINLKVTPTNQLIAPYLTYCTTTLDAAFYIPAWWDSCTTLASKLSLGSIIGASRQDIPPPERFYAGGPITLRGYRYLTVSPLDNGNKAIGGRSLMVISLEARRLINEEWGIVGFWEIGNVYNSVAPKIDQSQLQSVGLGLRYYTSVGPLRIDIAVPLNRRNGIDNTLQVYFSVGQTF